MIAAANVLVANQDMRLIVILTVMVIVLELLQTIVAAYVLVVTPVMKPAVI